ncbi:hypothetical protein [Leucobacter sp. PH1c]|uniref:hypothetical protein n=1 Tax=Leucobacter sp. PH1c TaxID=1397278 RepID=UPI00046A1FC9|nr:hypothetical protein [Leucobacter sp. PH1c]
MEQQKPALPIPGTGAQLVVSAPARDVVHLASGRLVRIQDRPDGLESLLDPEDRGADADFDTEYLRRLVEEIRSDEAAARVERWPEHRREVLLLGPAGDVLDAVEAALSAWGADVRRADPGSDPVPVPRSGLTVLYAEDARLRDAWTAWEARAGDSAARIRAYREGDTVFVDPLAVAPVDPTAIQVVGRRVAASASPEELDAWIRTAGSPPQPLDDAARTLLVARVVELAVAWARDEPTLDALRRTLWKLVAPTGSIGLHPLLPYPEAPERAVR